MSKPSFKLPSFGDHALGIVASSVAINCMALAFPLLMMQMYDRIIPHQSVATLSLFVTGVFVAALAEVGLRTPSHFPLRGWRAGWGDPAVRGHEAGRPGL